MKIEKFGKFAAQMDEAGDIHIELHGFHFDTEGGPCTMDDMVAAINVEVKKKIDEMISANPVYAFDYAAYQPVNGEVS